MGRNPNDEDCDVDACADGALVFRDDGHYLANLHYQSCTPLHLSDQPPVIDNDGDSIDDDLHEQLNFEHPEE
jgi:hypothetical protein